jgi:hypothetical protein
MCRRALVRYFVHILESIADAYGRHAVLINGDTTNIYGFIFKKGKQKMAARALE